MPDDSADGRAERIAEVLEKVAARRLAGEAVSDESILSAHPELMPELQQDLLNLHRVHAALGAQPVNRVDVETSDLSIRTVSVGIGHFQTDSLAGVTIPGYEIVREIHRGGQGVVYLGIQKTTKRKVAIKVMREGPFAGPKDKARFEREVQILAALNHPNIVAAHDSGVASGNFYFVMDYVSGQALDVWMASGKRTVQDTLCLFVKICDAVNAAHLKGVIHRDLKPGNIRIDNAGEPHILDFGLAKMVLGHVTDDTRPQVMTVTGQFIGSLPWASPEQAEGMPDKIDMRTDVYALGVVLYQMLTGRFPYDVVGTMRDVIERILNSEPAPPSKVGVAISSTSRRSMIGTLLRRKVPSPVDDEVETIVLKCLNKDRERRYQTAGDLSRDVRRYLAGDPIEAKRDSGWYVLKKTVRRYRGRVTVAAAFVLTVLGGTGIAIRLNHQASRTRLENEKLQVENRAATATLALIVSNYDPLAAVERLKAADPVLREQARKECEKLIFSPYPAQRVQGVRVAPWLDAKLFWTGVNGNTLWTHGEWLELCAVDWQDKGEVLDRLGVLEKAAGGTAAEKYVAFCLIGQLGGGPKSRTEKLGEVCVWAVDNETDPGVAMAAWWAGRRLGYDLAPPVHGKLLADRENGILFVKLPGTAEFRPGSPREEANRSGDEDRPQSGYRIPSLTISAMEVTIDQFLPFAETLIKEEEKPDAKIINDQIKAVHLTHHSTVAATWVRPPIAERFCAWLTEQAGGKCLYRLPTEIEWEYACRGGSTRAYCYGDDQGYLRYFAAHGAVREKVPGSSEPYPYHTIATLMPNPFGLFDMHGNVWEICGSVYSSSYDHYSEAQTRPRTDKTLGVRRGGASYSPGLTCRSASRDYLLPTGTDREIGFRVVMEVKDSP